MYNWYWSEKVPHKLALIDQDIRNRQYAAGHKLHQHNIFRRLGQKMHNHVISCCTKKHENRVKLQLEDTTKTTASVEHPSYLLQHGKTNDMASTTNL
jgi:hypothetical protein